MQAAVYSVQHSTITQTKTIMNVHLERAGMGRPLLWPPRSKKGIIRTL
jgi:hypothetical protein